MPVQTPQWMDVLCCCICFNAFDDSKHQPVSLVCCHTACRACLLKLKTKQCPFDQSAINIPVSDLPVNSRILKILEIKPLDEQSKIRRLFEKEDATFYVDSVAILESLCVYLKRAPSDKGGTIWSEKLSRPMQRKLINLLCCNFVEPEGRSRALKSIRSLGERCLTELLLLHQNPYHLSSNLWATVRARGCQFLGPAMQEEVLKLVLLALSEGALISRKVLVMYIVQTLEKEYPQASKTSVGHVVQLLYRASCFNVIKRDAESSLMQLKEEFRSYDALRREHDAQIVQIAMEAGLRISPDQWSALLYGDQAHKSHMQSIIDKLQSPQSFCQCIQELLISLQRTGDPGHLVDLRPYFESLAEIDVTHGENNIPSWPQLLNALRSIKTVIDGQVKFCENYGGLRAQRETVEHNVVAYKFKTSMCRDIGEGKSCLRGDACTFAHSIEEMERYRARSRLMGYKSKNGQSRNRSDSSSHATERMAMRDNDFFESMNDSFDPNLSRNSITDYWNASLSSFDLSPAKAFLVQQPSALLNGCPITNPAASPVTVITNPLVEQVMQTPMIPAAVSPVTVIATPAGPIVAAGSPNVHLPSNFPMNPAVAHPPIGAVPYQVIRSGPPPPLQPPCAHMGPLGQPPAPLAVNPPLPQPDLGFFWADMTGKFMQVDMPNVAGVIPLTQAELPSLNDFFNPPAAQSVTPQAIEAYYAFPPSGIPLHYEEFRITGERTSTPTGSFERNDDSRRGSHREQTASGSSRSTDSDPESHNSNCKALSNGYSTASHVENVPSHKEDNEKGKSSKLQMLGKKREEILSRLSALKRSTSNEGDSYDDTVNESEEDRTTKDFIHRIATSVLPEDFYNDQQHHRLKCTLSCGPELLHCAPKSIGPASISHSTHFQSGPFKEPLLPTASAPLTLRNGSRRNSSLRRSLSSDDEDKKKGAFTCQDLGSNYDPYFTWAPAKSPSNVDNPSIMSLWRHSSANMAGLSSASADCCGIAHSTQSLNTDILRSTLYTSQQTNGATTLPKSVISNVYLPFLPEDCADIRRFTADALRRQLENLPLNSRRSRYIRLELEARDIECWRSDDDQVIPFSGGMQVSRYGPISRNRAALTANSDSTTTKPVPSTSSLSTEVVHVKDMYTHPLTTAVVQPPKEQPMAIRESVDLSTIVVNTIPIVFQASAPAIDPATVGEKIEKVVEINEKLDVATTTDGASSVEREQLRMDLQIIRNEISSLDKATEEECLLKELKNVDLNIKQLTK